MRKLVTKRTITNIKPIPNADAIEAISIDGWEVVSKKGQFNIGDECLFFEIDSYLPANDPRFEFLIKTGVKDVDGIGRIRLKSARLRGQLSQGLALPIDLFPEVHQHTLNDDYAAILNVTKYERPEPIHADAAGNFPYWLKKTDEERIQNSWNKLKDEHSDTLFIPTLKLDGTSTTIAYVNYKHREKWMEGQDETSTSKLDIFDSSEVKVGELTVYSRNLQMKLTKGAFYSVPMFRDNIHTKLVDMSNELGESLALSGETMGLGIQGNHEKFSRVELFIFNIFSIDRQCYLPYEQTRMLLDKYDIQRVPDLAEPMKVFEVFDSVASILEYTEGESINAKIREGIVWKSVGINPPISFKTISNNFLLKVENKQ